VPKQAIQFFSVTNLVNKTQTFVSAQTRAIAYSIHEKAESPVSLNFTKNYKI
jgi:hypothetical protein